MTGDGAVLDFCGSFSDGDGIYDLTARVFRDTRVLRAAYAAIESQVAQQLFLQHSVGLNEQTSEIVSWDTRSEQISLDQVPEKQGKFQPKEMCFFLTSPFVELTRA